MILVNYKCNNKIVNIKFPMEVKLLKDLFKTKTIELATNDDHQWLSVFNHKTVNVYDLNYLVEVISYELDKKDVDKINALLSVKSVNSINELIHTVNYLNHYGLINNEKVENDPTLLAKELFNEIYSLEVPSDLIVPILDDEWKEIGLKISNSLIKHETDYGILYELDSIPTYIKSQIPVVNRLVNDVQSEVWILNPTNDKKLILQLPQYNDQLLEHLYRADIHNELAVIFDFKVESMKLNLFNQTLNILRQAKLHEVNNFCLSLNELTDDGSEILEILLENLNISSVTNLQYLVDNIEEFDLISKTLNSKEYVKERLEIFKLDDYDDYEKTLFNYLDYVRLENDLKKSELSLQSEFGSVLVPDFLISFVEKHKRKDVND